MYKNYIYTELLKEILKNEINNNVYIDKEKTGKIGFVFEDENKKYVQYNIENIIDQTMIKLNKSLSCIINKLRCDPSINQNCAVSSENEIRSKYNKYKNNFNEKKNDIIDIMSDIFDKNKEKAKEFYDNYNINELYNNNEIKNETNELNNQKIEGY